MSQNRSEDGKFGTSTISDEDLWELYKELGTSSKVAKACGLSIHTVRHRLLAIRKSLGLEPEGRNLNVAEAMESLVASVPLSTPSGGKLASIGVNLWEMGAKDELSQEIVKRGLDKIGATYTFGGKQPLDIIPHENPLRPYALPNTYYGDNERIFIVGDIQLGFWAVLDDEDPKKFKFIPFHDEAAIDVMLQAIAIFKPHRVVIIGDFFDFPQLSRFQQEPQWAQTMQASIQYGHDLIGLIRATAGDECKIDFIPGNHETRMQRAIVNNNPALMNLRKPGEKYSIYSIQSLMDFEKRNIECAAEYPSGEVWLAPRIGQQPGLVATHADPKRREMRADSIHGHLVLPGKWQTHTIWEQDGPVQFTRLCVSGCGNYSDTSDKFRLTRTNTSSGRSRMSYAQSFGTVIIDNETGMRQMDYHRIIDGKAWFMDGTITSNVPLAEAA
jgi:hypothetical protein